MNEISPLRRALGLLVLAVLVTVAPAASTSFVMMSDEALADGAPLVAQVRVVAVESSPAPGTPSTDYLVQVENVLKGYAAGSTIVVRVDGGARPGGLGLRIYGAPQFREGSRGVLFLRERGDGTYGVYQMMLGAFHDVAAGRQRVAMRDLGGTTEVKRQADGSIGLSQGADRPRDLARFAAWIGDRAAGVRRPADYFVELAPKALSQVTEEFTHLRDDDTNLPLRWNVFDSGGSVSVMAYSSPQPRIPDSNAAVRSALALWTNDPDTPVRYLFGGTTGATGGLETFDAVNTILFNDPDDAIEAYSCTSGGILAKGGPWFDSSDTHNFRGTTYARTQGADIVINNGIDCFFQASPSAQKAAEELFAHELGHTLGLGHSSEDSNESNATLEDALMYAFIHDDGRGARLNSDDRAGLRRIYVGSSGGGTSKCVANANTLCLQKKRFRVQVEWQNQFDGSSGVGRAIPRTDLTGFFSFGDPSNVELLVKILNFGDVIKVFYGQLTNLRFTITVTDTRTGEVKNYSNTTGECGGIDNSAFASAQAANTFMKNPGAAATSVPRGAKAGTCRGDRDTLCLQDSRFAVEVDWRNTGNNTSGKGNAVSLSKVTGTFFFTDPGNVELMTKILDFGDRFVFFYGTLSNLEYTIRVTDTQTGTTKTYNNPANSFCGGLDNNAF